MKLSEAVLVGRIWGPDSFVWTVFTEMLVVVGCLVWGVLMVLMVLMVGQIGVTGEDWELDFN